jgi:hypothetical protein
VPDFEEGLDYKIMPFFKRLKSFRRIEKEMCKNMPL